MEFISKKFGVTALPDSSDEAEKLVSEAVYFTATEQKDEGVLYQQLSNRLAQLEKSLVVKQDELNEIRRHLREFRLHLEKREELILRVGWLESLYQVEKVLEESGGKINSGELLVKLGPVQACPLKNRLVEKLKELNRKSAEEKMEIALKYAGETFINLGKTGRAFVLGEAGNNPSMEYIQALSQDLELRAIQVGTSKSVNEVMEKLEKLPLGLYHQLKLEDRKEVAEKLFSQKTSLALASLESKIFQMIREMDLQEPFAKGTIEASEIHSYIKGNN